MVKRSSVKIFAMLAQLQPLSEWFTWEQIEEIKKELKEKA